MSDVEWTNPDLEGMAQDVKARQAQLSKEFLVKKDSSLELVSDNVPLGSDLFNGYLFVKIHGQKFICERSSDEWYYFDQYYRPDVLGRVRGAIEDVVSWYFDELEKTGKQRSIARANGQEDTIKYLSWIQKTLKTQIKKLRTPRGIDNCLHFAKINKYKNLSTTGDKLDQNPWLLACKNGVIDLKTGSFRPGRPEDCLTKGCPVEWQGLETKAPTFDKLFLDALVDKDLVAFVLRVLGYALTGLSSEHVIVIFYGTGRNSKGTILETVSWIMGPLSIPVASELLLDQGFARSSSAPTPDIMALRGVRLVYASESDQGRRFSPSRVKWLSGGDSLTGRNPHDKRPTTFSPTHTLFLLTNHKPQAPGHDFAFWERVHLVPFKMAFVNREPQADNEKRADKKLFEKLKAEGPGILARLVQGCLEWQKIGLSPPPAVREATEEYHKDEDIIGQWIESCCYRNESAWGFSKDLHDNFCKWYEENYSTKPISNKRFGMMMADQFKKETGKRIKYWGIGLLNEE